MTVAPYPTVHQVKLTKRYEIAERTMAFEFAKPEGFTFKAGQSIDLTLTDPPDTDSEGNTRAFSIASVPADDRLLIGTRMRDTAFKRVLGGMPIGSQVTINGPFGNLVLHHNHARAAVFLTGGIGITPFRSIVLQAGKAQLPHRLFLFYSNRRPEDAPFLDELQVMQRHHDNYVFVPTMTDMEHSDRPWQGERGIITQDMLVKYASKAVSPIYYLAGPAGMVSAMRTLLSGMDVDADDIRTEEFTGY